MSRLRMFAVAPLLLLAGCSSSSHMDVANDSPAVQVEVWCEDDGAVSIGLHGDLVEESVLVGDSPAVEVLGGVPSLSRAFELADDESDAVFEVEVLATDGECTARLYDLDDHSFIEAVVSGDDEEMLTATLSRK